MLTWMVVLRTLGSQLGSAVQGLVDCAPAVVTASGGPLLGSGLQRWGATTSSQPQLPSSQTRDWTQSAALRDGCPGWSPRRKTCAGSATWVNVRLLVGGSRRARRLCVVMRQKLEPPAAGTVEVRVPEHLRVDERCRRGVDAE